MAQYKFNARGSTITEQESEGIINTITGAWIPNAPGNRDWIAYEEWRDAGNTADPFLALSELKNKKKYELKIACRNEIINGFQSTIVIASDANSPFFYETRPHDQRNLIGAITSGADLNLTVIDVNDGNKKKRVAHTAAEIASVYSEGVGKMEDMKSDLYLYYADVDAAADESAVDAITWVYPKP